MTRHTRTRSAGMLFFGVALVTLVAGPLPAVGSGSLPTTTLPRQPFTDLAPALGSDGTFLGASGLAGSIDATSWTLASDLAAGEPPRFAPSTGAALLATVPASWSGLGSNGSGNGALNSGVLAIAVSGTDLYVGGNFTGRIAKWDGSAWSTLGTPGFDNGVPNTRDVSALAVSGTDLYVGGYFTDTDGIPAADYVAKWDGSAWSALGVSGGALNGPVSALVVSGTDLYVGGAFTDADGILEADRIAKWDGTAWSAVGDASPGHGALNGSANALAVSGTDLYVGGAFTNAGGVSEADFLAKWDGSAWSAVGLPGNYGEFNYDVWAVAVSGTNLYVGGRFTDAAGNQEADYIVRWNGTDWSSLGSNGASDGALNFWVSALAVSAGKVYVGGYYSDAAGIAEADFIARWDGSAWSALGSNGSGDGALGNEVFSLAVSGSDLYVGGQFYNAGGSPTADDVAKWGPGPQPDGRIRKGSGTFVGNNVYNTTGLNQSKTGSAAVGSTITFGISIQNDGAAFNAFTVKATGTATSAYTVKYFRGTTDITAPVLAGTYQTPSLAPGTTYLITAKVKIGASATVGSNVTRLVTITSVANTGTKDAVQFIGKRA